MLDILQVVSAQVNTEIINPLADSGLTTVGAIFSFATNLLIGIGWGLVFIMLALGFTQYVMSKGDKTATQGAQQWLTYAVIGGVGLLMIGLIRTILQNLLGIEDGAIDVGGGIIPGTETSN